MHVLGILDWVGSCEHTDSGIRCGAPIWQDGQTCPHVEAARQWRSWTGPGQAA